MVNFVRARVKGIKTKKAAGAVEFPGGAMVVVKLI